MGNLFEVTDGARVYLRPIGFLSGSTAERAVAQGMAKPLGGGPVAFTHLEIIQRASTEELWRQLLGVGDWEAWSRELPTSLQTQLNQTFTQIQSPRPGLAAFARPGEMTAAAIMGIVNVTPDSFSDGGQYYEKDLAIALGHGLVEAGADILDIGGVSTRPGAEPVSAEEELNRVMPVIEGLKDLGVPLSIDTSSAAVMAEATKAGARIINDVTALTAEEFSLAAARDSEAAIVLMHAQGDPRTMQIDPRYGNVLLDVYDYLQGRTWACRAAGIAPDRLVIDPGIGFGKKIEHNLALLAGLSLFHGLGVPLLLGASRKGFIGRLSGEDKPAARMPGSLAAQLQALSQGVQIIRVHDVGDMVQAQKIYGAILQAG